MLIEHSIIETINDKLKNIYHVDHFSTSFSNKFLHKYNRNSNSILYFKKTAIKYNVVKTKLLTIF